MPNQQFTEHLQGRVEAIRKAYLEDKTEENRKQLALVTDALRIMTHGTGPARRRFRRASARNLARQGVKPARRWTPRAGPRGPRSRPTSPRA